MLVTQIPGFAGTNSLPPTPQAVFQHPQSPDNSSIAGDTVGR